MQGFFIMRTAQVEKSRKTTIQPTSLSWIDNPCVQKLLDVMVAIIAEEYIQIAKKNPDVFSKNGGKK